MQEFYDEILLLLYDNIYLPLLKSFENNVIISNFLDAINKIFFSIFGYDLNFNVQNLISVISTILLIIVIIIIVKLFIFSFNFLKNGLNDIYSNKKRRR